MAEKFNRSIRQTPIVCRPQFRSQRSRSSSNLFAREPDMHRAFATPVQTPPVAADQPFTLPSKNGTSVSDRIKWMEQIIAKKDNPPTISSTIRRPSPHTNLPNKESTNVQTPPNTREPNDHPTTRTITPPDPPSPQPPPDPPSPLPPPDLPSSVPLPDPPSPLPPPVVSNVDDREDTNLFPRLKAIFKEVLETEETYVEKLQILSYKLRSQIKRTCRKDDNLIEKFNSVSKHLINTLKQLYKFHSHTIVAHLTSLQENMSSQSVTNMWLVFQENYEIIEDLYKAYYVEFNENQRKIKSLCTSHSLINRAMLELQVHLSNIYPIDELNCANQRLLRYPLFMKSFMKHLNKDSDEYERIRLIHDELEAIAVRCNEHLDVSPVQLNKLKLRFDNKLECFDTQQLIWHGSLKKQSPRKHTYITEIYLILFSECILVCEVSGAKLEVKRQLSIQGLTVDIIENKPSTLNSADTIYPFRVNAVEKSYEFLASKSSEREKWINKIRQTEQQFENESSTFEVRQPRRRRVSDLQFGTRAPAWVHDIDVTRCQVCNDRFKAKAILSRRHHCRSCGRCICDTCSTKKLSLEYCKKEGEQRVCDTCYTYFTGIGKILISPLKVTRNETKGILFGDFRCISSNSIVWIDLQEDYHLHIYGARLDQVEDDSINLPEIRKMSFSEETKTFVLLGKDRPYRFTMESNHKTTFQKNEYLEREIDNVNNKLVFYAKLWHDAIHLARSKKVPTWYIRKHDSADSGFSVN